MHTVTLTLLALRQTFDSIQTAAKNFNRALSDLSDLIESCPRHKGDPKNGNRELR